MSNKTKLGILTLIFLLLGMTSVYGSFYLGDNQENRLYEASYVIVSMFACVFFVGSIFFGVVFFSMIFEDFTSNY